MELGESLYIRSLLTYPVLLCSLGIAGVGIPFDECPDERHKRSNQHLELPCTSCCRSRCLLAVWFLVSNSRFQWDAPAVQGFHNAQGLRKNTSQQPELRASSMARRNLVLARPVICAMVKPTYVKPSSPLIRIPYNALYNLI